MSTLRSFARRPAPLPKPADGDSGHQPQTPTHADRPAQPTLVLGKLVPEVVDPAQLRARENRDGE